MARQVSAKSVVDIDRRDTFSRLIECQHLLQSIRVVCCTCLNVPDAQLLQCDWLISYQIAKSSQIFDTWKRDAPSPGRGLSYCQLSATAVYRVVRQEGW